MRVKWDDKVNDNTYRYGGENCYDVILFRRCRGITPSVNPVSHRDYKPLQGVEYPSCSRR